MAGQVTGVLADAAFTMSLGRGSTAEVRPHGCVSLWPPACAVPKLSTDAPTTVAFPWYRACWLSNSLQLDIMLMLITHHHIALVPMQPAIDITLRLVLVTPR